MELGKAVESILSGGTTASVTDRIWYGNLPQQEEYPAVSIIDFGITEDTKDGSKMDYVTVSVAAHGIKLADCNRIHTAARADLERYSGTVSGFSIRTIRVLAFGPAIWDDEKKIWTRAMDYEVQSRR